MPPRSTNSAHDHADEARGIRLQKAMADAGVASRRACEGYIAQGRVTVNSQRITDLPAWVDPSRDRIALDGEALATPSRAAERFVTAGKVYVMLHKPRGVISTNDDPHGRRRVIDLIDLPGRQRVYPVGRLDADSTGLILLTNDGELTHRLTHPSFGVQKQYRVTVKGRLDEKDLERLRKGLTLAHKPADAAVPRARKAAVESVRVAGHETDRQRGDRTTLVIALIEGQNREIRRLLARLGFKVRKLERTAIGPVRLKGLAAGQWRMLQSREVGALRRAAGLGGKKKRA